MKSCLPTLLAVLTAASVCVAGAQQLATAKHSQAIGQAVDSGLAQAKPSIRLERILLVLDPGAEKSAAIDKFLTAQQTRGDASFHQWLTPAQFADRFSATATDAAKVADWLRASGFIVAPIPAGRSWIEFSGTDAQLEKAFATRMTSVTDSQSGATRYHLASPAHIPAAIASLVKGLASLDGTESRAAITTPKEMGTEAAALAAETFPAGLTPAQAQTLLQLPAKSTSTTGAGESIAIPTRSSIQIEDVAAFRKSFQLPESSLEIHGDTPEVTAEINEDETAATLAASWAGVGAPEAKIVLVPVASTNATDGLDLALAETIDNHLANTLSLGYIACEAALSKAHREFYAAAYRQAAAQGIAIIAATGDSGAAACHLPEDSAPVTTGFGVNALAATPWNTAISATAISATAITGQSETAWQQSSPAYATGGGRSQTYPTPEWQSAAGLDSSGSSGSAGSSNSPGHFRSLPDLSLPTAAAAFCETTSSGRACRTAQSGGSAVSAALFAGIAADLAQQYGAQGNLAPNLYTLARSQTNLFRATTGSAKLPCEPGTPDCESTEAPSGEIGYTAAPGYNLVAGLGSINAQSLIDSWATPLATGTANVSVEMTNAAGLTYNPSATVVLSAKVLSGSGGIVPTGTIQFYDQTTSGNTGTAVTLAADGTASYSESGQFTSGGHNVEAIYSGDAIYKAGTSLPVVINIQPSSTSLAVTPSTAAPTGGSKITVTGTVTSSSPGNVAPTGTLAVNLDGVAQGSATLATTAGVTSGSVSVTIPTSGAHSIQGTYSGDVNYSSSTSPAVTVTVTKSATTTTLSATPSVLSTGVLETFTATVAPVGAAAGDTYTTTGSISFFDSGTTLLGTVAVGSNTAVLTGVTLSAAVNHTVTAVYSGDATYSTSTSSALVLASTLLPVTVALTSTSTVWTPEQSVALTATITPDNIPPSTAEQNPSGYVLFYAGTTLISGQIPVLQGPGDTGVASTFIPHLPPGQYVVTARYSGDPTFGPAVSNSLDIQVEDFTITSTISNIDVSQGQSGQVPFSVASLGGLTGPIQVECEEQNPPQTGAIQCYFTPNVIDGSGIATLTVVTTYGVVSVQNRPTPWLPVAGGAGTALALLGLLFPIGKRARILRNRFFALAVLLGGITFASSGCTNTITLSSSTTTTGATPLGVHTLKITAAALVNTVTVAHYAYLTVNVTPKQ